MVFKFTKKLRDRMGKELIPLFPMQTVESDNSILGCWDANLVVVMRKRYILFVNEKTLLTIFIPLVPKKSVIERFRNSLFNELLRLGVPEENVIIELDNYNTCNLSTKTDRSVLGSINDLAWHYKTKLIRQFGETGEIDLLNAQILLNNIPHVKREKSFPDYYVQELFGVDNSEYRDKMEKFLFW